MQMRRFARSLRMRKPSTAGPRSGGKRLSKEKPGEDERKAAMRAVNPAFIPRNHLIAESIEAAEEREDFAPFEELMTVLSNPFEDQPGRERFTLPPRPEQVVHRTFCGT